MPKCTLLVGVPGSGKSTWINKQKFLDNTWIISTDNTIEAIASMCGMTYDQCFSDLIKFADKVMWADLKQAAENGERIYIDRTNLSEKSRKRFVNFLKPYGYEIECVVFPEVGSESFSKEEWQRRLDSRSGKTIPQEVLNSMVNNYEIPLMSEGFSKIIFV